MLNVVMFLVALQLSAAMTMDEGALIEKVSRWTPGNVAESAIKDAFQYAVRDLSFKRFFLEIDEGNYALAVQERERTEQDPWSDEQALERAENEVRACKADAQQLQNDYDEAVAKKDAAEQKIRELLSRLEDQ